MTQSGIEPVSFRLPTECTGPTLFIWQQFRIHSHMSPCEPCGGWRSDKAAFSPKRLDFPHSIIVPLRSASQSNDKRVLSQTIQHKFHQVISTSPIFATHSNAPTFKKNNLKILMNLKVRSAAGLLRSTFFVLFWVCIFRAAVLGGNYLFLSRHITHVFNKIEHMRLRNFAVSLSIF